MNPALCLGRDLFLPARSRRFTDFRVIEPERKETFAMHTPLHLARSSISIPPLRRRVYARRLGHAVNIYHLGITGRSNVQRLNGIVLSQMSTFYQQYVRFLGAIQGN